jgi:hypothetical protein
MKTAAYNSFFMLDNHLVQGGAYDPSVANSVNPLGTEGKAGSLFVQVGIIGSVSPFAVWQKQDDGISLNWSLFAGGGGFSMQVKEEGVSFVSNPTFLNFVGAGVTATLNGLGADITIPGGGGGAGTPERETFILTAPQIAGGVTLAFAPSSTNNVIANLQGAGLLTFGAIYDYQVVGTLLTFNVALQPLMVVGQVIQVQYSH